MRPRLYPALLCSLFPSIPYVFLVVCDVWFSYLRCLSRLCPHSPVISVRLLICRLVDEPRSPRLVWMQLSKPFTFPLQSPYCGSGNLYCGVSIVIPRDENVRRRSRSCRTEHGPILGQSKTNRMLESEVRMVIVQ